jgi:hypothetical protein
MVASGEQLEKMRAKLRAELNKRGSLGGSPARP